MAEQKIIPSYEMAIKVWIDNGRQEMKKRDFLRMGIYLRQKYIIVMHEASPNSLPR